MGRNIEMKATLCDIDGVLEKLRAVTKTMGLTLKTHDLYYSVFNGRMKIRAYEDARSDLIYYDRIGPQTGESKPNEYLTCPVSTKHANGPTVKDILERSLGVQGEVIKTRHLFFLGQTKIHVDTIDGLGNFIQLEVLLNPGQTEAEGTDIAMKIMQSLEISDEDLLTGTYFDLLMQNKI